jgi:wyosine [tRNA(Phe)-imidazoG37] synthetase (radical SAM superfamily)
MPPQALLYGPVPSRRLGFSLGVDILPFKTCSMDCVYCQLGSVPRTVVRRREYVPVADVLDEIRTALESGRRIDAVTFSGSGEPTLHSGIDRIIRGIKRMTSIPVVVLTNSSTLASPAGRKAIARADILVPSLDAATERIFARINRPHEGLTAAKIIAGLVELRKTFRGRIWLEIMLVKGINDGPVHLRALKKAVERIRPDRVQLNTVVRPPAERTARALSPVEMERIRTFFGENAETLVRGIKPRPECGGNDPRAGLGTPAAVIASFKEAVRPGGPADVEAAVLATAGRRPVTAADLSRSLGVPVAGIRGLTARLERDGRLRSVRHGGKVYFERA